MSVEAGHSSPTGRLVVAASKDRVVFAAGKDGSSARTAVTTDFPVFQSAISPGEDLVALRGWANDVLLVNLGDNEAPPRRLIHDGQVLFVAFLRAARWRKDPEFSGAIKKVVGRRQVNAVPGTVRERQRFRH